MLSDEIVDQHVELGNRFFNCFLTACGFFHIRISAVATGKRTVNFNDVSVIRPTLRVLDIPFFKKLSINCFHLILIKSFHKYVHQTFKLMILLFHLGMKEHWFFFALDPTLLGTYLVSQPLTLLHSKSIFFGSTESSS